MRHLFSFILFLLCLTAGAEDFQYTYEGQTLTYTIIDEVAKTCKPKDGQYVSIRGNMTHVPGNKVYGNLVIPTEAKNGRYTYKVIEIGEDAFSNCGLTSVTIPNSVTTIGRYAFCECSMTSLSIPNSVTTIGAHAFWDCTGLPAVNIQDITAWCNIDFEDSYSNPITHNLYLNGEKITELVIPNSVTTIGRYAFCRCSGLTSVTIPNSVTTIGYGAFYWCSDLTSATIGNSVTTIGDRAFRDCI